MGVLYLFLSICCSTIIMALFKIYKSLNISNFHAIIFNYYVAAALGLYLTDRQINYKDFVESDWTLSALMLGCTFIIVFYLMSFTAEKLGVAISQLSNKMSIVVVVITAILILGEEVTFFKIFGVCLALLGLTLALIKKVNHSLDKKYAFLPVILFLIAGFVDSVFNFAQMQYVGIEDNAIFLTTIYITAGSLGTLIIIIQFFTKSKKLKTRSIIGGFMLGFLNFGSLYSFMLALGDDFLDSSSIFPIRNMGIVASTAIVGYLLFNERLSKINWIGILLVLLSIAIIGWAKPLNTIVF